jgi:hypothetical protein
MRQLTTGVEEVEDIGITLLRWTRSSTVPLVYSVRIEMGSTLHRLTVSFNPQGVPTFGWPSTPDDIEVEHYLTLASRLWEHAGLVRSYGVTLLRVRKTP